MNKNKPIAVLGGGNIGHTIAADLTLGGYKVIWYEHPSMRERFKPLIEYGKIHVDFVGAQRKATAEIYKITMDISLTLADADILFIVIPAYAHDTFFKEMLPYIRNSHIIYVMTGNSGALRLRKLMNDAGCKAVPLICETNEMPYGVRIKDFATVDLIYGYGPWTDPNPSLDELPIPDVAAALPASRNKEAIGPLKELFAGYCEAENVVVVASSNANICLHPAPSILNLGRMESSGGHYYNYREGIAQSPTTQRIVRYVTDELWKIIEAVNGNRVLYPDHMENFWKSIVYPGFRRVSMDHIGPDTIKHRYITEDIPYALVPMNAFADILGVELPLISGLILVGSVVCEEDFKNTGRNSDKLGITNMGKDQFIEYITK